MCESIDNTAINCDAMSVYYTIKCKCKNKNGDKFCNAIRLHIPATQQHEMKKYLNK